VIAVTARAFANHDLCRVYAHVFEWNRASARVLEKAGYEFEGRLRKSVTKDGKTIDQLMYAVVRE
jgi:RimJ/RimL family protein N-acetyltransferase